MAEGKRRLAAILSADVAGYSRLMGDDERATVAALNDARAVFRTHIAAHQGRVVDTAGDSVLAVFDSVVEAVDCAIAVQAALAAANADLADDRRMRFRIGLNLGDVIEQDDGTVYGDGVNIAARLEGLADPGGITLSGTAFDHVDGKLSAAIEDIGEHEVKNIARPVRAYRMVIGKPAASETALPEPTDKPSIAVLPFDNLSGDPDQDYFADGIAEDLITALSRMRWLFVTARNSTFTYKGKAVDVKQVGREMGVRYVLEGSVRKGGSRVRVTAQLIEAATGNHVWAQRYDRELDDIFALQDEITETIAGAIEPELGTAERERARRKPPANLDAWESYQRGLWHAYQFTKDHNAEARRLMEQAIELDSNFPSGHAGMAYVMFLACVFGYLTDWRDNLKMAHESAVRAIALDDKDAFAHYTAGRIQTRLGNFDEALAEMMKAVDLNPSLALAHYGLATVYISLGRYDEVLTELDDAERLSPHDPIMWAIDGNRAIALMMAGDIESALDYAQRSARRPNAEHPALILVAAMLGHLGRADAAKPVFDKLMKVKPDYMTQGLLETWPTDADHVLSTLAEGLRKAGLDIVNPPVVRE